MAAVVTLNSMGTKVRSGGALTPAPPISNCVGKRVMCCVANGVVTDAISAPTGATYYLAAQGTTDNGSFKIFYKDGEAVEPTPSIAHGTGQGGAQIFVLDVAGGSFPSITGDGVGILAQAGARANSGVTGQRYTALTVVGLGFAIRFCMTSGHSTGPATAVAVTAGATQCAFFNETAANYNPVGSAELIDAATVFGSNIAAVNSAALTGSADTNNYANHVTIEFAVTQSSIAPVMSLYRRRRSG